MANWWCTYYLPKPTQKNIANDNQLFAEEYIIRNMTYTAKCRFSQEWIFLEI